MGTLGADARILHGHPGGNGPSRTVQACLAAFSPGQESNEDPVGEDSLQSHGSKWFIAGGLVKDPAKGPGDSRNENEHQANSVVHTCDPRVNASGRPSGVGQGSNQQSNGILHERKDSVSCCRIGCVNRNEFAKPAGLYWSLPQL